MSRDTIALSVILFILTVSMTMAIAIILLLSPYINLEPFGLLIWAICVAIVANPISRLFRIKE